MIRHTCFALSLMSGSVCASITYLPHYGDNVLTEKEIDNITESFKDTESWDTIDTIAARNGSVLKNVLNRLIRGEKFGDITQVIEKEYKASTSVPIQSQNKGRKYEDLYE